MASISDYLSLTAALVAVVSLIFAWKAVETAGRNNAIALLVQLQSIYQSDSTLISTGRVWRLYRGYQPKADGGPITHQQALEFIKKNFQEAGEPSADWKAAHDAFSFWRYLALLVRLKFIDERIVFQAYTSPGILGFLYPLEKAWLELGGETYNYERSLKRLYDRWMERRAKEK